MVWTNIGKTKMFKATFEGSALPSFFCLQLSTSATTAAWNADLSSTSQVTLVTSGNGYTASGLKVRRTGVDLTVSQDDTNDWALASLAAGYEWSGTGGAISNVSYVLLTDGDEALANPASAKIWAWWYLNGQIDIPEGAKLVINSGYLKGT